MTGAFSAFRIYYLIFTNRGPTETFLHYAGPFTRHFSARLFSPELKVSNFKWGTFCLIFYEFFLLADPRRGGTLRAATLQRRIFDLDNRSTWVAAQRIPGFKIFWLCKFFRIIIKEDG
jgi:hypothetical protein